jgi:hypothetical protein
MKKKYFLAMWGIDDNGDDYCLMQTKEFDTIRETIDFSKLLNLHVGTADTYIELCGADYDEEDVCVNQYAIEVLQRN